MRKTILSAPNPVAIICRTEEREKQGGDEPMRKEAQQYPTFGG